MNKTELLHIEYERSTDIGGQKGEITERYVIPSFVPAKNMKAIDVSKLKETERQRLLELFKEYNEYRELAMSTIFSFDDWLEQTSEPDIPLVAWRTFKMDNVKVLD